MPKRERDKGVKYERKIAKLFSDAFKRELRRVPLSGGLDIKCDIYDPRNDDFPYWIECKHRESLRFQSLFEGTSYVYEAFTKTDKDAMNSHLSNKYVVGPRPLVVFRGGDFREDMVMFKASCAQLKGLTEKADINYVYLGDALRDTAKRHLVVLRLRDFLNDCYKGSLGPLVAAQEDDGYID